MSEANQSNQAECEKRRAQTRRQKIRRKEQMQLAVATIAVVLLALIAFGLIVARIAGQGSGNAQTDPSKTDAMDDPASQQTSHTTAGTTDPPPTWMTFPADRELKAQQYFVYSCESGSFLTISGSQQERIYPASVTKLFTAYVAMQYVQPDTQITAGDELDLVVPGSSVARIQKGDVMTAEQLVEAMLLPSGNDAAYVLAAEVGRIMDNDPTEHSSVAVDTFVAKMNEKAAQLGMTGTNFANPDGIHSDTHYTTFADLVLLGKLSLQDETVMKYAGTSRESLTSTSGEKLDWKNTNALIDETSKYYCPYAVGLKTGQTPYAGSCLLSAFAYEGQTYLIGVFGCPEEEDRFEDALQLFTETRNSLP